MSIEISKLEALRTLAKLHGLDVFVVEGITRKQRDTVVEFLRQRAELRSYEVENDDMHPDTRDELRESVEAFESAINLLTLLELP